MICFAIIFHLTVKTVFIVSHHSYFDNILKELNAFKDEVFAHRNDDGPFLEYVVRIEEDIKTAVIGTYTELMRCR